MRCGILSRAAAFARFRGISTFLRNFAEFGSGPRQLRHILVGFRRPWIINYCMWTWLHREICDCHSGSNGILSWAYLTLLPVYLADRLYLSVAVEDDKCCIFGRVQTVQWPWKIVCYAWKICHNEPWNLANWPAEFGKICCRKLRFILICEISWL